MNLLSDQAPVFMIRTFSSIEVSISLVSRGTYQRQKCLFYAGWPKPSHNEHNSTKSPKNEDMARRLYSPKKASQMVKMRPYVHSLL